MAASRCIRPNRVDEERARSKTDAWLQSPPPQTAGVRETLRGQDA